MFAARHRQPAAYDFLLILPLYSAIRLVATANAWTMPGWQGQSTRWLKVEGGLNMLARKALIFYLHAAFPTHSEPVEALSAAAAAVSCPRP